MALALSELTRCQIPWLSELLGQQHTRWLESACSLVVGAAAAFAFNVFSRIGRFSILRFPEISTDLLAGCFSGLLSSVFDEVFSLRTFSWL